MASQLIEVLFDGRPQADAAVATAVESNRDGLAAERKRLDLPPDDEVVAGLATAYENAALGEILVRRSEGKVVFDFGEWKSEMASREHPDGTASMVIIAPGIERLDFVVGSAEGRRTLTLRAPQHEYVFAER